MKKDLTCLCLSIFLVLLPGCSHQPATHKDGHPTKVPNLSRIKNPVPKKLPKSKRGNPASYVVFNKRYKVMQSAKGFQENGIASWYGTKFHGRLTSSGEPYDMFAMTAAHKSLPLPTYVEVKNLKNGRTIIVKVNDRGPFVDDRIIDLSYTAAHKLGMLKNGTAPVKVTAIDPKTYKKPHTSKRPRLTLAKKTTPIQTTSNSSESTNLYLQLGAFSQKPNADALLEKILNSANLEANIHRDCPYLYKVRLGPFNSPAEAQLAHQRLNANSLPTGMLIEL